MFLALKQDIQPDTVVPLPQYDNRVSIVNKKGTYALLSNVCPHQNSRINKCASTQLQCPYHGLKFKLNGQGIDSEYKLESWSAYQNQTMLFDQYVNCSFLVDTSHMVLEETRQDFVDSSTAVIMDVFVDIEHIPTAHPGVYDSISITKIDDISWGIFDNGSIQFVPAQSNHHMIDSDKQYNIGACWMAVYPGTMIEWQPGALFVTVAIDTSNGCKVQVFKYRDKRYDFNSYKLNSWVWEQAWAQDRELAELIVSPAVKNLDGLKAHHREWMSNAVPK